MEPGATHADNRSTNSPLRIYLFGWNGDWRRRIRNSRRISELGQGADSKWAWREIGFVRPSRRRPPILASGFPNIGVAGHSQCVFRVASNWIGENFVAHVFGLDHPQKCGHLWIFRADIHPSHRETGDDGRYSATPGRPYLDEFESMACPGRNVCMDHWNLGSAAFEQSLLAHLFRVACDRAPVAFGRFISRRGRDHDDAEVAAAVDTSFVCRAGL